MVLPSGDTAILDLQLAAFAGVPVAQCFKLPVAGYRSADGCLEWLQRNPNFSNKRHAADDYCAVAGTTVNAAADGYVAYARQYTSGCPNWGHLVGIEHLLPDGTRATTLYGHVIPKAGIEGTIVKRGDPIGTIARYSCWSDHVHFGAARRAWGMAVGQYPAWVKGYFADTEPTSPYEDPLAFVSARSNCPPTVGSHTYTRSGTTRTVTVEYSDPESTAPTLRTIRYEYKDLLGIRRTASGSLSLSSGSAGNGTYRWSQSINGTEFKFWTEWRDGGGAYVRYPANGLIQ